MKTCNQCGAPLAEDARFCGNCGAPVETSSYQETTQQEPVYGEPGQSSQGNPYQQPYHGYAPGREELTRIPILLRAGTINPRSRASQYRRVRISCSPF